MFTLRIRFCFLLVFAGILGLLSILESRPAWAESPYPREQVEDHLRTMFPDPHMDNVPKQHRLHVGFFTQKKNVRFSFVGLKKKEIEPTKNIFTELFIEILHIPATGVDPTKDNFDLLVFVSDNLSIDGMLPAYKSALKGPKLEETYIKSLQKESPEDHKILYQTYIRNPGETFIAYATERDHPKNTPRRSFEQLMRFTLMSALTTAMNSNVIQPSAVNNQHASNKADSFAPIDRAILRVIFAHDDWAELTYEIQMQRLTYRVMHQLENTP